MCVRAHASVVFSFSYSCFNERAFASRGPPPLSSIFLLYGKWVLILKQIDLEISSRI